MDRRQTNQQLGGILDIAFKGGVPRKFIREFSIADRIQLTSQSNSQISQLKNEGPNYSRSLLSTPSSNEPPQLRLKQNVEEFRVKRKRNKRPNNTDKITGTVMKNKNKKDQQSEGSPMEIMLRRNTPKVENIIDSQSSGTHKDSSKGDNKDRKKNREGSQAGSLQALGFRYKFDPTAAVEDIDDFGGMGYGQIEPIQYDDSSSDKQDKNLTFARQKHAQEKIGIHIQNLLKLQKKPRNQGSQDDREIGRTNQRKRRQGTTRKPAKENIYLVDQQIELKQKPDNSEQTMQFTRFNNQSKNDIMLDGGFSILDLTKFNADNILKQFSVVDFDQALSAVKEFQKSYYQARSLLRTPLNQYMNRDQKQDSSNGMFNNISVEIDPRFDQLMDSGSFNDENQMSFDPRMPDHRLGTIQQVTQKSSFDIFPNKSSFIDVDVKRETGGSTQIISAMIRQKSSLNETIREKKMNKNQQCKLFYQLLLPRYRLQQNEPQNWGQIFVKQRT